MRSLSFLLTFASSAFAYLVNVPSESHGWTSHGHQPLQWSRVDTDSPSFTVVLTNQDRNILPQDIILAYYVDGTHLYGSIRAPYGGFPTGDHFRVNLVKDPSDTSTIFAQSSEFSIHGW